MSSERIAALYTFIDGAFDAGEIGDGTYQFAADLIQLLDPDEQDFDVVAHAKELYAMSANELREFRREDLELWEQESPGTLARRFEVGEGNLFANLDELIVQTDFAYVRNQILPVYLGLRPITEDAES